MAIIRLQEQTWDLRNPGETDVHRRKMTYEANHAQVIEIKWLALKNSIEGSHFFAISVFVIIKFIVDVLMADGMLLPAYLLQIVV